MASIDEIAPDVFRISIYVPDFKLQFNQFLVRDDRPMLFHTGMKSMFDEVYEAVETLIEPDELRYIGFSHFEVDECGSLNRWLETAPRAEAVCSLVGAQVNMADFADRPARGLTPEDVLETGNYRFQFIPTPHLPHGWDAGVMFEQTNRTMLCSDLLHQNGDVEAVTDRSVIDRVAESLGGYEQTPLASYMPYSPRTNGLIETLAELNPRTLATMHGTTYRGDGAEALREFGEVMKEIYG